MNILWKMKFRATLEGRAEAFRGFEAMETPPSPRAPHSKDGSTTVGPRKQGLSQELHPLRTGTETSRLFPNPSFLAFFSLQSLGCASSGVLSDPGPCPATGTGTHSALGSVQLPTYSREILPPLSPARLEEESV